MVDRAPKHVRDNMDKLTEEESTLFHHLSSTNNAEFVALCEGIRNAYEPIQWFCIQNKRSFDYLTQKETPLSDEVLILEEPLAVAVQKMMLFVVTHVSKGVPFQSFQIEMQRLAFGTLPFVRRIASKTSLPDHSMSESEWALFGERLFSEKPASKVNIKHRKVRKEV